MNARASTALLVGASLLCGGCATIQSVGNVRPHSPRFFAGTRLDYAAIEGDRDTLDHYGTYAIFPPTYPRGDLAFSVVADTVLFPFAVIYTITEPWLGAH